MSDERTFCKGGFASLSVGQRYIYISLLGYAALREPPLLLNSAVRDGSPEAASNRELADWSGVSPSTMHETLKVLQKEGVVTTDKRTRDGCLRCSAPESMIRLPNLRKDNDSAPEHPIPDSATESPPARPQGPVEKQKTLSLQMKAEDSAAEHHIGAEGTEGRTSLSLSSESLSRTADDEGTGMTSRAERLADLRRDVPQEDLDLIDEYLDNAAMENKTNQITPGRRLNETRDLLELREEIGEAAWRHGMSTANGALAPNINYVKKVAAKHDGGTRYDQPPAKKPKRYNPTGETITGWDHLDEVMKGD